MTPTEEPTIEELRAAYEREQQRKAKHAAYMAAYNQRPEIKAKRAAYYQRPEIKAKAKAERIARLEAKLARLRGET